MYEYCLQVNIYKSRQGLELNATHQLLVCAYDVNMLGKDTSTIKEKQTLL
jgi:hypothetical protein